MDQAQTELVEGVEAVSKESTSISVRPFSRPGSDGEPEVWAEIQLWPEGGQEKPSMDFMHKGDHFRDYEGRLWLIETAIQDQQYHRYFEEDGGLEYTYSWQYEALMVA